MVPSEEDARRARLLHASNGDAEHAERVARDVERKLPRCTCLEYGHGLSLTRVNRPDCPEHGVSEFPRAAFPAGDDPRDDRVHEQALALALIGEQHGTPDDLERERYGE